MTSPTLREALEAFVAIADTRDDSHEAAGYKATRAAISVPYRLFDDARSALALATPSHEAGRRAGLEEAAREMQSIWRCAIGDAVTSLDALKNEWCNSKRKAEREAGKRLSGVLDLIWAGRDPAPSSYSAANEAGKVIVARVRTAIRNLAGDEGIGDG